MSSFLSIQTRIAGNSARQLLKKLNIEDCPIDPEKIAESLGVKIVKMFFEKSDISGLLKRIGKDGNPVIAVNETDPPARQKFTIAHEIGHYLLHKSENIMIDTEQVHFRDENSSTATSLKEIQANQFAAELLMPNYLLIEDLKTYINAGKNILADLEGISSELSERYGVSREAMTIRIGSLIA